MSAHSRPRRASAGALPYPCRTLQQHEREIIVCELKRQGGNKARVAKVLDISKSTLYAKLALYRVGGVRRTPARKRRRTRRR